MSTCILYLYVKHCIYNVYENDDDDNDAGWQSSIVYCVHCVLYHTTKHRVSLTSQFSILNVHKT